MEKKLINNKEIIDKAYIEKAISMLNLSDKLSKAQQELFIEKCIINKLNPIKDEIFAVPFRKSSPSANGEQYDLSIFVSYQVILKRAESFPQFDGYEIFWKEGEEYKLPANQVCVFIGHRKDRKIPLRMEFLLSEWYNQKSPLWASKRNFMMEKTALSVGLKRLFPLEFNGMPYTDVEQWNREVIEKTKDTIIVKDNLEPKELENE